MKSKEELNALKEEVEALNKKPAELRGEEPAQASGSAVSIPSGVTSIGMVPQCSD